MAHSDNTPTTPTRKTAPKGDVRGAAAAPPKQTASAARGTSASGAKAGGDKLLRRLQLIFYAVWSVVGLIAVGLFVAALVGVGNVSLRDTDDTQTQQPPATAQPQQQPQPSQEQLDCVREQVGDERFAELEQGEFADDEESVIIQECLQ